jgi:predicted metal-dependent hydrolase
MSNHTYTIGTRNYNYSLIEEDRKTVRLSVYPNCDIVMKVPQDYDLVKREKFLRRKWRWIDKQLAFFSEIGSTRSEQQYVSGGNLLYLGRNWMIKVSKGEKDSVRVLHNKLEVVTSRLIKDAEYTQKIVDGWMRARAKLVLAERYKIVCNKLGILKIPDLAIKQIPKRWGSFFGSGKIVLNPKLIKVNKSCIDYVIVHELCHLKFKNHTKGFYELLESRIKNWKEVKIVLERIGAR